MIEKELCKLLSVFALGVMCGCDESSVESEVETEVATNATESVAFDIPRTLYERMFDLYDENRTKELMPNEIFDPDEMFGLMECGLASNAVEIVKRPRGKMCFVDDLCTDEERRELWPFELAAFEATLEAKMKIGEQGYQLVDDDGKLQARNPTVRWFNAEMDAWVVKQLDDKFERMSADTYCKILRRMRCRKALTPGGLMRSTTLLLIARRKELGVRVAMTFLSGLKVGNRLWLRRLTRSRMQKRRLRRFAFIVMRRQYIIWPFLSGSIGFIDII